MANRGLAGNRCRVGIVGRCLGVLILLVSPGCRDTRGEVAERVIDLGRRFQDASLLPPGSAARGRPGRYGRGRVALEVTAAGRVFALSSSGSLIVPVDPYTGDADLRFDFRLNRSGTSGAGSLTASLIDAHGQRRELAALADPTENWTTADLNLGVGSDDYQFVLLEAVLDDASHSLRFRRPQLRLKGARGPKASTDPEATTWSAGALPNVVIVVLDAARASNLGIYGYERDTTPTIDGFAAEGLVFRNAFSECPNTSCSIPNLISGIPFVDLGRPEDRNRVSDRIVTLAEYLGGHGYRAIALSANPNNSIPRNTSQGFDEFVEMWAWEGLGGHPERRDPHRLSRRAIEVMRGVEPTQPVFMLLHYVPPHEPYEPRPEFDVFGDPAYMGPVRPGLLIRKVYTRPGQTLNPADVGEMIALYDGNLRMADDAVDEVFDALRAEGRWDNSIILVTADHGEAFFEHGVQGHNSTLYDEMLHIPFVLRLPEGRVASYVDTGRLVILSDVVPTILGQLGLEPRGEVGGVDLLLEGDQATSRVIFHRLGGERLLSARTQKWNAVFGLRNDTAMLFDLANDPRELENVVEDSLLIHHGLASLLNGHLREVEALSDFAAEGVEIPEDDIRALRALGYVQ